MLAAQEHLRAGNSPESLKTDLGIYCYRHPDLPLVGFKYSQIDSPKTHPVVRDCRGLVLEEGSWDVVAKPFRRFFNAGEDQENFQKFAWDDCTATTKHDGSLIILYNYRGVWHVNTSGSFGLGECGFSGKTWREVFWETAWLDEADLDPRWTYIFEMWTPFNLVVRSYPKPTAFLLSMFETATLREASVAEADDEANMLEVPRPEHHHFTSLAEVHAYLREVESRDRTYEGVVLRDRNNERYKVKTDTYTALHHLLDNGNLYNPKRLVPLVLAGEIDEIVAWRPDIAPHIERVAGEMEEEFGGLLDLWRSTWQIEGQKDFALSIAKKSKFVSLLFQLRRDLGGQQSEQALRSRWRESGDMIVKSLYA